MFFRTLYASKVSEHTYPSTFFGVFRNFSRMTTQGIELTTFRFSVCFNLFQPVGLVVEVDEPKKYTQWSNAWRQKQRRIPRKVGDTIKLLKMQIRTWLRTPACIASLLLVFFHMIYVFSCMRNGFAKTQCLPAETYEKFRTHFTPHLCPKLLVHEVDQIGAYCEAMTRLQHDWVMSFFALDGKKWRKQTNKLGVLWNL